MIILHLVLLPCIYIQPIRPLCSPLLIHYRTRAVCWNLYVFRAKANGAGDRRKKKEKGKKKLHFSFAFIARAKDEGPRQVTVVSYRKILISSDDSHSALDRLYKFKRAGKTFSCLACHWLKVRLSENAISIEISRNVSTRQNIRNVSLISDE